MYKFWIDGNVLDNDNDRKDIIYQGDDGRMRIAGKVQVTKEDEGSFFSTLHEAEKDGEL